MTHTGPTVSRRRLAAPAIKGVLILAALVALVLLGRRAGAHLGALAAHVRALGAWAPIAFIAAYAVAAVAFVPGSLLTLAAGVIFGLWRGVVYVFAGATLGASAAFLIARYVARGAVARRLQRHPRFAAIDAAIGHRGRTLVVLLRLSPVFPYNLLNYALGVTRVRFVDYLVASIGMLPGTVLYVYYGKVAGDVAVVAGGAAPPRTAGYYVVLALGLAATIAVTALVTRLARRALRDATQPDRGPRSTLSAGGEG